MITVARSGKTKDGAFIATRIAALYRDIIIVRHRAARMLESALLVTSLQV